MGDRYGGLVSIRGHHRQRFKRYSAELVSRETDILVKSNRALPPLPLFLRLIRPPPANEHSNVTPKWILGFPRTSDSRLMMRSKHGPTRRIHSIISISEPCQAVLKIGILSSSNLICISSFSHPPNSSLGSRT